MLKPIRRRKKSPKYIPQIAKKAIDPDRLSQIEQDNNLTDNIIFEDDNQEQQQQDQHDPIEPIPEGPLTADFIKLQHVRPPAIQNIDNITDWQRHLGISKPSNLDRMISNPHYNNNRPKTYRRNSFTNSNSPNSPKQTSDKRIKKEIDKQLKKEQETMINNSLIKPLTRRGIKVINQKTIYH